MGGIDSKTIIDGSKIFEEFEGALTAQYVLQQLISDCKIKFLSAQVFLIFVKTAGLQTFLCMTCAE